VKICHGFSKTPFALATWLSRRFAIANQVEVAFKLLPKGKKQLLGFSLDPWLSALRLLEVWLYQQKMFNKIYFLFY